MSQRVRPHWSVGSAAQVAFCLTMVKELRATFDLGDAVTRRQGHARVLQLYFNSSFWRSIVSEKAFTLRELEAR